MIKHQYKLLLVAIFFFASSLSYADISDESINKLLELSGLTMQVDQFPDLIKAEIEQAKQQSTLIPDSEYGSMVNSFNESILPSEIIEGIRVSLKKSINEEEAQKLLAWYESDLGKEIRYAEESASTPEAYKQMRQSAQSLLENVGSVQKTLYEVVPVVVDNMHQEKWVAFFSGNACFGGLVCATHPP